MRDYFEKEICTNCCIDKQFCERCGVRKKMANPEKEKPALMVRLYESDKNCDGDCKNCVAICGTTQNTIFLEAADAIDELLAAVPHWISVEDEPPKENGRYLVRYKRDVDLGDEETVHEDEIRIMRFFVGDGWRYPIICNDHVRLVSEEVTHWMPLPSTEGLNEA